MMKCKREKSHNVGRHESETENLILNSQIYCKPVKRFENRSDKMKFWSSRGSRIDNKLKTVNLSSWKIKQKIGTIVYFGMDESQTYSY